MRPGGRVDEVDVAGMLEVVEPTVVERIEDELAREPEEIECSWPVLGNERTGRGEVLAGHDLGFLVGSVLGRPMSCPEPLERRLEVALLLGRVAGLAELVPARIAQHRKPVPKGRLRVVPQPGRRLHDVGVGVVDDPALGVRHRDPPFVISARAMSISGRAGGPSGAPRRKSDAPSDQGCGLGYAPGAMDLRDGPEDVAFRAEVRRFLDENLVGEFAELGGRGGSGDETFGFEVRRRWEKVLADGGWTCLGWPVEHGGRGATMTQQVIFNEEYARAAAPGRVSVMGEGLLGPTLIHYGTPEQKARFLPPIQRGRRTVVPGLFGARRRK